MKAAGSVAVVLALVVSGCGGSDHSSTLSRTVEGSVTFPSPKPQNDSGTWATREIEQLLVEESAVTTAECRTVVDAQQWKCMIQGPAGKSTVDFRANPDGTLSWSGPELPGLFEAS